MTTPTSPTRIIGLDLGQASDYSAWIAADYVERPGDDPLYDVRHIERVRDVRYPAVVARTKELVTALRQPLPIPPPATDLERVQQHHDRLRVAKGLPPMVAPIIPRVHLVVDYTGVGRPVADMIVDANLDCTLTLVTITGALTASRSDAGDWHVPKGDLAATVQVLLQSERLRLTGKLPHTATLTDELVKFRATINPNGHMTFGVVADWREGNHDDLVLSLALACWYGEKRIVPPAVAASGNYQRSRWTPDGRVPIHDGSSGWR